MTDAAAPVPEQTARPLKISCHNCMQKLDVSSFPSFTRIQCPVCGTELIVPAWFDTYLLEEQGGSGGMAAVYRALDPALDREVAIKVLKPEISDKPDRVELFLHEARAAATINHFAVVPIYTCGVHEGQAYIVMQYMGGGSLDQQLKLSHGKLPILSVVTWIRDIAEGLENAKNHGIIHHDVKPGNILLDSEGKAKIGDFGIAQIIHSGKTDSTEESIQDIAKTWLSPHYVSPEKVRTGKEGFEGDIYSLGATFYHLLTGVTPFSDENVEELLRIRLIEQPLAPHLQRVDIDMELSQLVMMMMSRSPSDRPPYKTIIASLNRIIKANSAATVPLPVKKIRSKADPALIQELRSGGAAPGDDRSRFPAASLILLFFLLAAGASGLYYAWTQGFLDRLFPQYAYHHPDTGRLSAERENRTALTPDSTPGFGVETTAESADAAGGDGARAEKMPEITAQLLEEATAQYRKWGRPAPDAPALLSGNRADAYLKNIPQELRPEEERRLNLMRQLPSYIVSAAAGNVYQTDSFLLADGTEYGEGEAVFEESPVYRERLEAGGYEDHRLDWNLIPAQEVLTILLYYTTYRENAVHAAGGIDSSTAEQLADAFLRYAVFAQWYGYYEEAAKAAVKALAIQPGPRTETSAEHLLLR